jgi:hypothetical protein
MSLFSLMKKVTKKIKTDLICACFPRMASHNPLIPSRPSHPPNLSGLRSVPYSRQLALIYALYENALLMLQLFFFLL